MFVTTASFCHFVSFLSKTKFFGAYSAMQRYVLCSYIVRSTCTSSWLVLRSGLNEMR